MPARLPLATYRLQFNRAFRFADARALAAYLEALGVTHLYASPLVQARSGSAHGYDVVNPARLNTELGGEEEFAALAGELRSRGLGLVLDIVPNHMAASAENPWWLDVLENGPASAYAGYFDIDWQPPLYKLVLPVLGDAYRAALERQELALQIEAGGLFVHYFQARFPLDPRTYRLVLEDCRSRLRELRPADPAAEEELGELLAGVERLPPRTADANDVAVRRRDKDGLKRTLGRLYEERTEVRRALDDTLRGFNGRRDDPASFDRLDRLLADQAYRLDYWRTGIARLNYRRFFDISHLVGLRIEAPEVFDARHAAIFRLVREGWVSGLRVDHVDGLYDPLAYLRRLQARLAAESPQAGKGRNFYVIVEKILGGDESLPADWPVSGTTGYEFLNALNRVFIEARGLAALEKIYTRFTGARACFAEVCLASKRKVMAELFPGETAALERELSRLAARDAQARRLPAAELAQALREVTACLPVYRTYTREAAVAAPDRVTIEQALKAARARTPAGRVRAAAWAFLRRLLLLTPAPRKKTERLERLAFVRRWQQFTGPVMAKGLEDTACYVHNSLVSLNEVGVDPRRRERDFGVAAFHRFNRERGRRWPATLNATSTHDTKRSQDVRARLNLLSELAREWEQRLRRWSRWNRPKKPRLGGRAVPDRHEEVLLYQTLLGAWPLEAAERPGLRERVENYLVKAAREAKVNSSWLAPAADYEAALKTFVGAILDESGDNRFPADFLAFQKTLAAYGALNALSQVLLKIAAPGAPDFYQGTELWDLSLVDPDNRRPVDFARRARLLDQVRQAHERDPEGLLRELLDHWEDGRVKLYTIWKALGFRRAHPELFLQGDYRPLRASGRRKENVCAFARRYRDSWAVGVAPRRVTRLAPPGTPPLGRTVWGSTTLLLPREAPHRWRNVLTGETLTAKRRLPLAAVFGLFPVALLAGD